jgi:hypothetical protein
MDAVQVGLFVFLCFHRTNITWQYSDAGGVGGLQLNTLASLKAPSNIGKVHVSVPISRVPVGNTEMTVETGTLFELRTKQTSDPLLFQFGMMYVETFDRVADFRKRASAGPPRVRVVASTDAEIQTLNLPNILPP